jgi:DNA-binding HxlR family transcriptional regulator
MKSYGQFCPIAKAAEIFCERWTPLIIRDLAAGASRFSELKRGVPLMSQTLLSKRLKELESEGIVERRRAPGSNRWTYHLTPAGEEFAPIVLELGVWGQRWSRRQLEDGEIDLGLLLWALERGANPDAFGTGRSVVRLEFPDQPANKRLWWFVNDAGKCQLCVEEPGFDVDLYLTATLPDMIYIWRGDLPVDRALDSGRLEALGDARMRRHLKDWLGIAVIAHVESRRPDAVAV